MTVPSCLEALDAMKAKIEQGWTQGASARMAEGTPCESTSKYAVCWCLAGAKSAVLEHILKPASNDDYAARSDAFHALNIKLQNVLSAATLQLVGSESYVEFNDARTTTKADVLNLIDKAKEIAANDTK
jgi:hypothetical protein